jgi:hypothetical protein
MGLRIFTATAAPCLPALAAGDFINVRPTLGGVVCTSPDRGETFAAENCVSLPEQTAVR